MATKTLSQLANSLTDLVSTDLFQSARSGADYKITAGNLARSIVALAFSSVHESFAVQDISTTDKEFDLTVYESGGASELPEGAKVKCPVTGGDGTAKGYFTTALDFVDQLGNDLGAGTFYLFGTGYVIWQYDPDNSQWILVDDGREKVYARCEATPAAGTGIIQWNTVMQDNYAAITTGTGWRFTAPKTGRYLFSFYATLASSVSECRIFINGSNIHSVGNLYASSAKSVITVQWDLTEGDYVEFRTMGFGTQTDTDTIIMINEI